MIRISKKFEDVPYLTGASLNVLPVAHFSFLIPYVHATVFVGADISLYSGTLTAIPSGILYGVEFNQTALDIERNFTVNTIVYQSDINASSMACFMLPSPCSSFSHYDLFNAQRGIIDMQFYAKHSTPDPDVLTFTLDIKMQILSTV